MTTKRIPKAAASKIKITDRAVDLFKQMRSLSPCVCEWGPMYWERVECSTCQRWRQLHSELHKELQLFIGNYPAVDHPPDVPPHDQIAGGRKYRASISHAGGAASWDGAQDLFDELMQRLTGYES